jgi:hypothetical protein
MYELTLKNRKQLERASLRAQAEKPKIEEVYFGAYKVWSSNPATPWLFYCTAFERNVEGDLNVVCSCPTQKTFCKHVAAAVNHFLMREKEFKAEEARMLAAQEMTDSEWGQVELRAESEMMIQEVEAMLEKDRLDVFGI